MKKTMICAALTVLFACGAAMAGDWLYIGGYGSEPNEAMKEQGISRLEGIYVGQYDQTAGKMDTPRLAAEIGSPNFFALSPDRSVLYTCCDGEDDLAAFKINAVTGDLTLINRAANGGVGCTHIDVSPDGKWLASANYTGGDFAINRLAEDGSIGEITANIAFGGTGPEVDRQTKPYGHSCYFVPCGDGVLRLMLVDLGTDRVFITRVDSETGQVTDDPDIPVLYVPAGGGSRHLAWRVMDDGTLDVFVNNELNSTVSFFSLEFGKGSDGLTYWGTWLTVPEEFRGKVHWRQDKVDADPQLTLMNSTAETAWRANPDGSTTVYVSNRGHNSIAVFKIVERDGVRALAPVQYVPTQGNAPRYFCFDRNFSHMIVANKRTGTMLTFDVADDGTLTATGNGVVKLGWPCAMALIEKP
ncbi:MAG: lactonase family protein [Thermoguttaceae bacterium]|nr:lactonase family protein [Thermoguttaceae bacterium]